MLLFFLYGVYIDLSNGVSGYYKNRNIEQRLGFLVLRLLLILHGVYKGRGL